jgi:hypothetical protein
MEDVLGRLHLYILAGQVALINQSLAQAEALFKAAITLIPEVPNVMEIDGQVRSTEEQLGRQTLPPFTFPFLPVLSFLPFNL